MRLRLNKHLPFGGASTCHKPIRREPWKQTRRDWREHVLQGTSPHPGHGRGQRHLGLVYTASTVEAARARARSSRNRPALAGPAVLPGPTPHQVGLFSEGWTGGHKFSTKHATHQLESCQGPLTHSVKSTDRLHRSREQAAGDRRGCLPPRFLSVTTLQGPQVSASHWELCPSDCWEEELLYHPSLLGPFQTAQKSTAGGAAALRTLPWGVKTSPIFNDSRQGA